MEGTYEILSVIGRSGLGTMYQARFAGEGAFTKLVTLKMLDEGVGESDEVACRLRDEARVLGFLKHQSIVQVDRLARLAGRWTLVLEYADGVSLASIIEQGPMPAGPALEVVAGVAGALHAAYTTPGPDGSPLKLQHRDIKPGAILVDGYGAPRVTDFGISRACFPGREARTRSFVVGSFEYMSPERLALEEGGPWSDVYTLGQVFYALLMGHSFGRSHPSERHHKVIIDKAFGQLLSREGGVDEGVLELLRRMLAMEPHERPDARSVERRCHELVRLLQGETLRTWAEQIIEPMVLMRSQATTGGLVGSVLREGDTPSSPKVPHPPDPSLVGSGAPVRRPPPVARDQEPQSARRELEPLPVHTFSDGSDDDATEIMTLGGAGLGANRGVGIDDPASEATEAFSRPLPSSRPRASERSRPPVDSVEELFESVTSTHLPSDLQVEIDLSPPDDSGMPLFRPGATTLDDPVDGPYSQAEVEIVDEPEPEEEEPWGTSAIDDGDEARPTVLEGVPAALVGSDIEADTGMVARPTLVSSWGSDEIQPEHLLPDRAEVTAITPPGVSGEVLLPPKNVGSDTLSRDQAELYAQLAAEQTHLGEDLETSRVELEGEAAQPRFSLPAGSQDEHTAVGEDLESARANLQDSDGPRINFPVEPLGEPTATLDAVLNALSEREVAQPHFDAPAGSLDEHTAIGGDLESARAEREVAQPRFDSPAGSLDEQTAVLEDLESARAEQEPALPHFNFSAVDEPLPPPPPAEPAPPPPPAEPAPPPPAEPAPPPPAEPAPPPPPAEPAPLPPPADFAPPPPPADSASPPPADFAPPPPPADSASPPPADSAPPPPPADSASPPPGLESPTAWPEPEPEPTPAPPPAPMPEGAIPAMVSWSEDGLDPAGPSTNSAARPWVPVSGHDERPQHDEWVPPSAGTLPSDDAAPAFAEAEAPASNPAPPSMLPPAPIPDPSEPEPSLSEVLKQHEPRRSAPDPGPEPTLEEEPETEVPVTVVRPRDAAPEPLEESEALVADAPRPGDPPVKKKGKGKLLLVLAVLLVLGIVVVVGLAGILAVVYFLI